MLDQVETGFFSIVVVAPFSPASFHPSWFVEQGLIGKETASAATGEGSEIVVLPKLARFTADVIEIIVQQDRLQLVTSREDGVAPMLDMFIGLASVIEPLKASSVGLNVAVHYRTGSKQAWHKAGHIMSGGKFWKDIWGKHVGLFNLQLELDREDDLQGKINLQVQPSNAVESGVFVNVNDHLEFPDGKAGKELADFVSGIWAASRKQSEEIIKKVVDGSLAN